MQIFNQTLTNHEKLRSGGGGGVCNDCCCCCCCGGDGDGCEGGGGGGGCDRGSSGDGREAATAAALDVGGVRSSLTFVEAVCRPPKTILMRGVGLTNKSSMPSAATSSSVDWTLRRAAIIEIGGARVVVVPLLVVGVVGGGVRIATGFLDFDFFAKTATECVKMFVH